jgi:DNA-binding transcriptional regulator YdaS (Cro superfamily)
LRCLQPNRIVCQSGVLGHEMAKQLLTEEDVLRLLRNEIRRSGGQYAWARRTALNGTYLNRVLHGTKSLTPSIAKALGLRRIVVCSASEKEIRARLQREAREAGSIAALSRRLGINRTTMSMVVHRRRSPSPPFFRALNVKKETLYEPA